MTGNKYHARKTKVDGITFDSAAEARRYQELRLMEKAGQVRALRLQVRYSISVNGHYIGFYKADFVYRFDDQEVVEDVKGVRTPVYRLKKKLVEAIYGIVIDEVEA